MTKKERLLAALKGEPVDRPPISFWRHFSGPQAHGALCVEKHIEFYRKTDLDFIKVMHDGLTAPCSLDVHSLSDLKAYRPLGRKNAYITAFTERASRIVDAIGDEVYVYANVFSPLTLLRRIGDEKLRYYVYEDEKTVTYALDVLAEELSLLCSLLVKECGCLGVFAAFQGNEVSRYTEEQFYRIVYPYDKKMLEAANEASPYNILHFCAWDEIPNRLGIWNTYPGCAVNWAVHIENLSLARGRQMFDGRTVMGGFDNRRGKLLYSGSKRAVQEETQRLVRSYTEETGSNRGLILGADCSFLPDFRLNRFLWVSEALDGLLA